MEDHPSDSETFSARSATALRNLEERAQAALATSREQVSRLEADITKQLEQIAATLQEQTATEAADVEDADRTSAGIIRLTQELERSRTAWDEERSALETARDDLAQQMAQLEAEQRASKEEWQTQLAGFEQKLGEQQSIWNGQRSEWNEQKSSLEREQDELQQKFELALEDVQRFRGRVAELEQDLASCPDTNADDSAEMVALRAERDALSERVNELEHQPVPEIDTHADQQLADLQRRFELAVEDVRELKTKNAQLESQLAAAGGNTSGPAECGGMDMDWESQKRRMLASLEDEGVEDGDPDRQKERATIESTIDMTDAVVADKDREIAELKTQLATAGSNHAASLDEAHAQKFGELVDADEVIAEHRKRIAQIEREMEEKLRAAELELSVERAKIARQKVELEDLRADLDSRRSTHNTIGATAAAAGMPRRRWLSKLGLGGDES